MKYMTFNSSCAYAGLANMLEKKGIDVEDYEIALEMKLPFMVGRNEDGYEETDSHYRDGVGGCNGGMGNACERLESQLAGCFCRRNRHGCALHAEQG